MILCQKREKILFWKTKEKQKNLIILDHCIIRKFQICSLTNLTCKVLHLILVDANTVKSTAQDYFENHLETSQFNWKKNVFSKS